MMSTLQNSEPPRTAIVLDDEVQIGTFVCTALSALGLMVRHYTDPLQFLLEIQRAAPDILFLDLALGQADAVDVIRKLEFLKFAGRVYLISGRDQATLREFERIGRVHGLRMMQSLQKPFRLAELKAAIQEFPESDGFASASAGPVAPARPANPGRILEEALRRQWLEVWYQPKIDLRTLTVCGAEALIRARHPNRGIIEPGDLLPAAGDQLYKPLTRFVVRQAIADWLVFAQRGWPLQLAINVPASILIAPGFVDFIRNALPDHPEFPGLIAEVTEDEAVRDIARIHEVATQLRLYNIGISVDDFGSAYASLSRIKDLPFREVKLYMSFVANCAADPRKRGLCQAVSDLAHCFGATACAEGVETLEDLRCLANIGFDTAQGLVFAESMPAHHFLEFLTTSQEVRSSGGHSANRSAPLPSAKA